MSKAFSNKALPAGTVLREWRLDVVLGVGGFEKATVETDVPTDPKQVRFKRLGRDTSEGRKHPTESDAANAAAAADDKGDPTGTWKWTTKFKDQERTTTLKLKKQGDKLTGTISGGKMEAKISDGTFKNGEVRFTVTREFKDQKFTTKYDGKLTGDTIKGTIKGSFGGKDFEREWEATRSKLADGRAGRAGAGGASPGTGNRRARGHPPPGSAFAPCAVDGPRPTGEDRMKPGPRVPRSACAAARPLP
jgi:hypothetical protein